MLLPACLLNAPSSSPEPCSALAQYYKGDDKLSEQQTLRSWLYWWRRGGRDRGGVVKDDFVS